jgi:phytoene dehydrogenase-like protein
LNAAVPRAVVIGSGPNGLAAAITLARAGLEVEVHEAEEQLGGGLRSAELTLPGFVHDVCSSVHPLSLASPLFRTLELDVDWVQPDAPAAHPFDDGTAVLLEHSLLATAVGLGRDDGAYRRLVGPLVESWREVERVLLGPHPVSPRTLLRLGDQLGGRGLAAALRAGLSSARALAEGRFADERTRAWFAGHAAHSMLPLERRPSAGFGLTLAVLGHVVGWPFPRGGSQRLADALAARLRELGGEIRTSSPVDSLPRADLVVADVVPRELLRLARGRLPERYARGLQAYRHGPGAFKVDWALDGPIPWEAEGARRAATVHLGGPIGEVAAGERVVARGGHPDRPFVLCVQYAPWDTGRAPAGKTTAWAYCHVPSGSTVDMTDAIEAQVERFAPGFRDRILARATRGPAAMAGGNPNYVGGDINAGIQDIRQLIFRPGPLRDPYWTGASGLYLCSSSTPPGGGVHGMSGYLAARSALKREWRRKG